MPSPYDILGTIFGVLSLLGCVRCAYGFLKVRQPFAQVVRLEDTIRATRQRIDELELELERRRYSQQGNPTPVALHWQMRVALDRIEEESSSVRKKVRITRPKTIAAVLLYTVQYGINSKRSRRIRQWTKRVSFIRYQIDFPNERSSNSSRISELGTVVETSPPSGIGGAPSDPVVATSSGMEILAVPETALTQRSHVPPHHASWRDRMRSRWVNPPIPKTVYGGDRLDVIGLVRRVWQAHWSNADTSGSTATSPDDAQDNEEFGIIVAHWTVPGAAEASSTSVRRGAPVPVVRRGKRK